MGPGRKCSMEDAAAAVAAAAAAGEVRGRLHAQLYRRHVGDGNLQTDRETHSTGCNNSQTAATYALTALP